MTTELKKLETRILIFFIFSIPFQTRLIIAGWHSIFNEWTSGFVFGTDILIMVLLLLWLFRSGRPFYSFRWYDVLLAIFALISAVSVFVAINSPVAWYRLLLLVQCIALFMYVRGAIGKIVTLPALAWALVASAVFQAVVGITQYFLTHSIGLNILGESYLNLSISRVAVFIADGVKYLRAYGTTPHPNILATWLMIGLWSIWYLWPRAGKYKYVLLSAQVLVLLALVLTYSRTAFAIYCATFFVVAIVAIKKRWLQYRWLILISVFCALAYGVSFQSQLRNRASIDPAEEAVAHRVYYNRMAGGVVKAHPFLGLGIGQFVPTLMRQLGRPDSYFYQPVHNIYLLISSETGPPSLVVFLLCVFFVARGLFTRVVESDVRTYCLACLGALLFMGLFDHFLWSLHVGNLLLWLVLAMAASVNNRGATKVFGVL